LLGALNPGALALWSTWAEESPRLLTPALLVCCLLAARIDADRIWLAVVAVGCALCAPMNWSRTHLEALISLAPFLLMAAAVVLWARGRAPVLLVVFLVLPLSEVRARFRYPLYAAAAQGAAYDLHPLSATFAGSWPIWERLDDSRPKRVAVTAGWDGVGHNWYRYPLLGQTFENELVYASPTREGDLVDYRSIERWKHRADLGAWARRLVDARVDFVVALAPEPPERAWMQEHPEMFRLVAQSVDGRSQAYRFTPLRSVAREAR
jgi:hypothetical protein